MTEGSNGGAAPHPDGITGVVLAGGLGRRMGNRDKGLVLLEGQPLVARVLARFSPQVDELLVNANRHLDRYAAYGYRVVSDEVSGFAGPLAGLHSAMRAARFEWLACVPCDAPDLPRDLVSRLRRAVRVNEADAAMARAAGRVHPVFCICRRSTAGNLQRYLENGGRRMEEWLTTRGVVCVDFDDEPEAFRNVNTPEDLESGCGASE